MQKLHMAEMNLMGLLGVLHEYKAPTQYIEEAFPRLKFGWLDEYKKRHLTNSGGVLYWWYEKTSYLYRTHETE